VWIGRYKNSNSEIVSVTTPIRTTSVEGLIDKVKRSMPELNNLFLESVIDPLTYKVDSRKIELV